MAPLVTVVTSTWHRPHTLINRAVASVRNQTYPDVEHVVVIDGDDPATVEALDLAGYTSRRSLRRFVELGRNWSHFSGDGGYGATCRLTGAWLGGGEFVTYLDDDAEFLPEHIEEMVNTFEPSTDFVTCAWGGSPGLCLCPGPPPGLNRTDTSSIMHRALVLKKAGGFHPDGYAGDGNMVERWLRAGLTWKFKEKPTLMHNIGSNHGRDLG